MSTKESKLWKKISLLQKGRKDWHLTRIESSTINGIPDVYGCIEGRSFWLELKATDAKNCGLSKFQVNWHLNHQQAGGTVRILNAHASQTELELLEIRASGVAVSLSRATPSRSFSDNLYHLLILGSEPVPWNQRPPAAVPSR
tara:strand:+ start:590 stop:1018 length:429 start_codon:yes stop_codon:yes gene_type:complete